jgi:hypothetical protein
MPEITTTVIGWAVPFVLGLAAAWATRMWDGQKALRLGMRALLRDRITELYERYEAKGWCPLCARENVQSLSDQYRALKGNGHAADLVERMMDMPTDAPRDPKRSRRGRSDASAS